MDGIISAELQGLRNLAHGIREKAHLDKDSPVRFLPDDACKKIRNPKDLENLLRTENKDEIHEIALLLEAWLRFAEPSASATPSPEDTTKIREWVTLNITPPASFALRSSFDPAPPPSFSRKETLRWRALSTVGIRLLAHLHRLDAETRKRDLPLDPIVCLASYTDSRDPWTTPEAQSEAEIVLDAMLVAAGKDAESRVLNGILTESIKPRFIKSKNPAVTEQGRRVIHPLPQPLDFSDMEVSSKPWKFRDLYIVTVYRWVLTRIEQSTLEQHWPLLVPPLLALLDDDTTSVKIKGCELLDTLMKVTPTAFLTRTGLGEVFQTALMPCLSYLPTLTPEEESIRLLNAVYPSLLLLARTRFPRLEDIRPRQKALDKIMREGILRGYWHVSENVRVAEMLVWRMADVIAGMEILCVKHLKELVPLLESILSNPFCLSYPPLLHAAAHSLRVLSLNGRPRIGGHRVTALSGLCLCWCKIQREEKPLKPELSAIAQDLLETLKVLETVCRETGVDVALEFDFLRESNEHLESFLIVSKPENVEVEVKEIE